MTRSQAECGVRRTRDPVKGRRTGEILRGLLALLILAGLLGGIPLALYAAGGLPWPAHLSTHMPSWDQITEWLWHRDDGALLLAVLRTIGWSAWASFSLSTLLETTAHLYGLRTPHLAGLGAIQRLTAHLITSATLIAHSSLAAIPASAVLAASAQTTPSAQIADQDVTDTPLSRAEQPIIFGAGVLAGGVVTTLARLRHRQRQERRPGRRIALPDNDHLQRVERQLHRHAEIATQTDQRLVLHR